MKHIRSVGKQIALGLSPTQVRAGRFHLTCVASRLTGLITKLPCHGSGRHLVLLAFCGLRDPCGLASALVNPFSQKMACIQVDHPFNRDIKIPDGHCDRDDGNNHRVERIEDNVERVSPKFLWAPAFPAILEFFVQCFVRYAVKHHSIISRKRLNDPIRRI